MTDKTWTNVCQIFVYYLTEVEQKSSLSNLCPDIVPVQSLSNICPIFFWHGFRDILSDFCPMFVHVQYLSMSKVCPTLKTTLVGYHSFTSTKIIWALHWISLSTRDIGLEQICAISHSRCKRRSTPHYNRFFALYPFYFTVGISGPS